MGVVRRDGCEVAQVQPAGVPLLALPQEGAEQRLLARLLASHHHQRRAGFLLEPPAHHLQLATHFHRRPRVLPRQQLRLLAVVLLVDDAPVFHQFENIIERN